METSNYLTLAISSGLVAGIIATLGNILISVFEKKSERKLEAEKYANSINDYRYKELHKFLKVVLDHSSDEDDARYHGILSNYGRAKPLLSSDLTQKLDADIKTLCTDRNTDLRHNNILLAETSFIEAVQTQLERLMLFQINR